MTPAAGAGARGARGRRASPADPRARGRRMALRACLGLALAVPGMAAGVAHPASPPPSEHARVRRVEGGTYVSAVDLARLLSATRYWRADVRKMVLRAGAHRIVVTAENPFVVLDGRTVRLPHPVRGVAGDLLVPVDLLDALPRDSTLARVVWEPRRKIVVRVTRAGVVGAPRVDVAGPITRVTLPADHPEEARVVGRARGHFRVQLAGTFVGPFPDDLGGGGLVRSAGLVPTPAGTALELELAPETRGFRVAPDPSAGRLVLEFSEADEPGFERFAPEGAAGPRPVRVVVLDPAHGGSDAGVRAGDLEEKDLTLALARRLAPEIERRLSVRVVLTRTADVAIPIEARAEAANRARADLVVSLHFDGFPSPGARGAAAYCAPATEADPPAGRPGSPAPMVLPWRDVGLRHAVESRALAEAVLGALDARDLGPTRLREVMPLHLLGVNAPGIMLECATLTSPADRERVSTPGGLSALAVAIAEGLAAWQRNAR